MGCSHLGGCTCPSANFAIPRSAGMMPCFAWGEMANKSRWALQTSSRPLLLKLVIMRLAMAWEITCRDGEDVCGCRMVAIDCVIVSALFEANGLIRSAKAKHNITRKAYVNPEVLEWVQVVQPSMAWLMTRWLMWMNVMIRVNWLTP